MYGSKQMVLRWIITAVIFTACMVSAPIVRADSGEWTWMSGSDTVLQAGIYGTKGVPAEDNVPGARYGSVAWTDSTGNFWLFGGYGLGSADTEEVNDIEDIEDLLNDLWRYDPDNDTWTWMSGSDMILQAGIYGTKGVSAADNMPGGRYGSVAWTDSTGDLWLFGGFGLGADNGTENYLNDLWRYDPDNATWTWMSGSDIAEQPGIYGTKGLPSQANVPGARYESVAWTDNSTGDLWLFGGFGLDSADDDGILNDLWRYDPDNNTWTWVSGSDRDAEESEYGTQRIPAADNVPGARLGSIAWTDSTGDLWLFGGYGFDERNLYYLSDLWRYDPDNATWTWMSGPDKVGKSGKYGAQGMIADNSVPGARYDGIAWMDLAGDLWLFGGYGLANSGRGDNLNDLWRYYPNADLWTWISGSDKNKKPGIYGTKGTSAEANVPGARNGSVAWTDSDGNLWLFGGYAYNSSSEREDYVNDLWRFELPADTNMRIDKCSVKAGKTDSTDSITFSGFMDAGKAPFAAALGGEVVISLWTDKVPDPDVDTTFRFPINADTFSNGTYKSPKADSADKSAPVLSFSYDSAKGTMNFSASNVDLTGLYCPITLTIQIDGYVVQELLEEDIVNGTKPCPLRLVMGVLDSLDVSKFKAKNVSTPDSDSFEASGTFTVDGSFDFNTALPVDIMLGSDTFSLPGGVFSEKNGVYSCKKLDSGNGLVTAKFDTVTVHLLDQGHKHNPERQRASLFQC